MCNARQQTLEMENKETQYDKINKRTIQRDEWENQLKVG